MINCMSNGKGIIIALIVGLIIKALNESLEMKFYKWKFLHVTF